MASVIRTNMAIKPGRRSLASQQGSYKGPYTVPYTGPYTGAYHLRAVLGGHFTLSPKLLLHDLPRQQPHGSNVNLLQDFQFLA